MQFSSSTLYSIINAQCSSKAELTPGDGLTLFLKGCNKVIADAITDVHNKWQGSVKVNNVMVNGGLCIPSGPVAGAVGIGPVGCLSTSLTNTANTIIQQYVIQEFDALTEATKGYMTAVGSGYEAAVNDFIQSCTFMAIAVSGGNCTCTVAPVPTPGGFSGGIGKLPTLQGSAVGLTPTVSLFEMHIKNTMTSHFYVGDGLTPGIIAHIRALAEAFGQYFNTWLSSTTLDELKVEGGMSLPIGALIMATGQGGRLI